MKKKITTIRFEDKGQDFLEWDVNSKGIVIASRPLKSWLWVGFKAMQPQIGKRLRVLTREGERSIMNYKVIRIKSLLVER